jgi:hypothetical protein
LGELVPQTRLFLYPSDDDEFRDLAFRLMDRGADTPGRLQTQMRESYPRTRVVEGIKDGVVARWYVYRDGRLVSGGAGAGGSLARRS